MAVNIYVEAEDLFTNKVYFILENNRWTVISGNNMAMAMSNYTNNAAELYIALSNCTKKEDAVKAIQKYGCYLKKIK